MIEWVKGEGMFLHQVQHDYALYIDGKRMGTLWYNTRSRSAKFKSSQRFHVTLDEAKEWAINNLVLDRMGD